MFCSGEVYKKSAVLRYFTNLAFFPFVSLAIYRKDSLAAQSLSEQLSPIFSNVAISSLWNSNAFLLEK